MSEHSFLKRRWKLLLNVATAVALMALVVATRHQLVDTFKNLSKVHAWALFLLLPVEWLNYHAQTKVYQGLFALVGNKLKYKFLFIASLELNFVNHVFPSGGVSGISYFGLRLRNDQITASRATLVQIMKMVMVILSFEVLLIAGLLFMAVGNRVNDVVIMVTTLISVLMVVGTVAFAMIIGSERRIRATFGVVSRLINKAARLVRKSDSDVISVARAEHVVMDLHESYRLITAHYSALKWTLLWAFLANLTEVFAVYVVYIAFGKWVNFGSVILAYAVANFAGLISVLPGGVGIYEALMTGVLVAAGVPAGVSLPVTVMYRVLNTLIQVPPGYFFYHRNLARHQNALEKLQEMHDD